MSGCRLRRLDRGHRQTQRFDQAVHHLGGGDGPIVGGTKDQGLCRLELGVEPPGQTEGVGQRLAAAGGGDPHGGRPASDDGDGVDLQRRRPFEAEGLEPRREKLGQRQLLETGHERKSSTMRPFSGAAPGRGAS